MIYVCRRTWSSTAMRSLAAGTFGEWGGEGRGVMRWDAAPRRLAGSSLSRSFLSPSLCLCPCPCPYLSTMVCRRCAMVSTVHCVKFSRTMRWMSASVSLSIDAVACPPAPRRRREGEAGGMGVCEGEAAHATVRLQGLWGPLGSPCGPEPPPAPAGGAHLVQHEDLGLAQQGSGDAHELSLARGEVVAALGHLLAQLARQRRNVLLRGRGRRW